ncbi:hypothetical protein GL998_05010 [Facklamia sp. 253]|nr:hypothetical protein [Facklamia sp. 252]NEW67964.1 hypothetical protein [Facklamia sp. 253]
MRAFKVAKEHEVGIIAHVPLESGLLSRKYNINSMLREDEHRHYNRLMTSKPLENYLLIKQ